MDTRNSRLPEDIGKMSVLLLTLAVCACILLAAPSAFAANSIKTEVVVGKSAIISLPNSIARVSLPVDPEKDSDKAVIDVVVISPREIQINGRKLGSTSLVVWDKAGNKTFFDVQVTPDLAGLEFKMKEIAPGDNTWLQTPNAKTVVAMGTVTTQDRWDKINKVLNAALAPKTSLYILQGGITKETIDVKEGDTDIRFVNLIEVTDPVQVLLQVTVASIDRNAARELGINWSTVADNVTIDSAVSTVTGGLTEIAGLGAGAMGGGSGLLTTENITGATFSVVDWRNGTQYLLRALASKGLAKVLAEPNMLVRSGESGEFLAGGEVPIPVVQNIGGGGGATNAITVEYKTFGVTLNFRPKVNEAGVISLAIDPAEVSTVAGLNVLVSGISLPSFNTNRITTSVDLREGESFVIGGLLNSEWNKELSKIPLLGDIPIIGAFFRTQDMEKTERELVFVVTPKIMKPMRPGDRVELPGSNEPTARQQDDMRWIPLLPTYRSVDPELIR